MIFSKVLQFWVLVAVSFFLIVWLFKPVLTPFVVGAAIAYLLNPVMIRLARLNVSRRWSALLILFVFFFVVTIFLTFAIPLVVREATQLAQALPDLLARLGALATPYITQLQAQFGGLEMEDWTVYAQKYLSQALSVGAGFAAGVAGGGMAAADAIITLLLVPIVAYFMMKEWPKMVAWAQGLMPPAHRTTITGLLSQMDLKIAGFIRGQITVCVVLGLMYAIALTLAGLKSGFLIGLMTGVLSIIPYVGSTIGLVSSLAIAWFQSGDITYVGLIAAIFFTGQFIEGNFIAPKLVGDSVGLHPLWIIFALLAGGTLFGIVGMFLAIPVAAVISVLTGFALDRYRASPFFLAGATKDENTPRPGV